MYGKPFRYHFWQLDYYALISTPIDLTLSISKMNTPAEPKIDRLNAMKTTIPLS